MAKWYTDMYDLIWVTKEGRMIPVSQMDTSHIVNCIMKIRRSKTGWRKECLERLELELFARSLGKQ